MKEKKRVQGEFLHSMWSGLSLSEGLWDESDLSVAYTQTICRTLCSGRVQQQFRYQVLKGWMYFSTCSVTTTPLTLLSIPLIKTKQLSGVQNSRQYNWWQERSVTQIWDQLSRATSVTCVCACLACCEPSSLSCAIRWQGCACMDNMLRRIFHQWLAWSPIIVINVASVILQATHRATWNASSKDWAILNTYS